MLKQSRIDGVLNIYKPPGITSHGVVLEVRRQLKIKKIGHTGILDPGASGVLPLCIGRATKISQFLLEADKEYRFSVKLGVRTDTQDADGQVLESQDPSRVTKEDLLRVTQNFTGEIEQVPPMFSALKRGGVRLYTLARQGLEVPREPRRIRIYKIELLDYSPPLATYYLVCSKGTYIRTICDDIGKLLGCGAHLYSLVRTRSGWFTLENALPLKDLPPMVREGTLGKWLFSLNDALAHLPTAMVTEAAVQKVKQGRLLLAGEISLWPTVPLRPGTRLKLQIPSGELLAVAEATSVFTPGVALPSGAIVCKPKRVFYQ